MVRNALCAALGLLLAACSGGETPTNAAPAPTGPTASASDFRPLFTTQELMAHVIDYNAFNIWHNQGWVYSAEGVEELFPTDEEGWFAAESAAATLAEASNLLLLPGRIPEDDSADWIRYAHELSDASMHAMQTAEAQDKEAFFDAGGDIYVVCSACHLKFVIGED